MTILIWKIIDQQKDRSLESEQFNFMIIKWWGNQIIAYPIVTFQLPIKISLPWRNLFKHIQFPMVLSICYYLLINQNQLNV